MILPIVNKKNIEEQDSVSLNDAQKTVYIICGIDGTGKDTVISGLIKKLGYFSVIHCSKPQKSEAYNDSLEQFQKETFKNCFSLIEHSKIVGLEPTKLIFNRLHLGEAVYAPLYRGYSGDYIFQLESEFLAKNWNHVRLVLLTTDDFSIIRNDGHNFDFSKIREEQDMFKAIFQKSQIVDKRIVSISDDVHGGWRKPEQILNDIISD